MRLFGKAFILALACCACNGADLTDGQKSHGSAVVQSSNAEGKGSEDATKPEEGADEPVMVGGAYLVKCETTSAQPPVTVGCQVQNSDGTRVAATADTATVTLGLADGTTAPAPVTIAGVGSPWHVTFTVPTENVEGARNFTLEVDIEGRKAAFPNQPITWEQGRTAIAKPESKEPAVTPTTVSQPAPVTFVAGLTCNLDATFTTATVMGVTCTVDATQITGTVPADMQFKFANGMNEDKVTPVVILTTKAVTSASPLQWVWQLTAARADLTKDWLFVELRSLKLPTAEPVTARVRVKDPKPQTLAPQVSLFGDAGINGFTGTVGASGCAFFTANTTTDYGQVKEFTFEVLTDTADVEVVATNVCGIGGGGDKKSPLSVVDAKNVAKASTVFDRTIPNYKLPAKALAKGIYRVSIASYRYTSGDYDDFVIQSLTVSATLGSVRLRP